jgi:hypothetical protein
MNNREIILKCLKANGPLTAKDIAAKTGVKYYTVTANLRTLRDQNKIRPEGKIRHDGEDRTQQTYVPTRMRKPTTEAEPQFNFAPEPEVTALQARLAELEAFKAEAVARHPDLIQIDYEPYRAALVAFYQVAGWENIAESMAGGAPITHVEQRRIAGLIAAAALLPEATL